MNLTFREKSAIAKKLENNMFLSQDKALLKKYLPTSELIIRSPSSSRPNISFEIVFVLLDYVDQQTIESNRGNMSEEPHNPVPVTAKSKDQSGKDIKKKSRKKKSIQTSIGQNLRTLRSEMHTRCIRTGSIAIAGCTNLIRSLKKIRSHMISLKWQSLASGTGFALSNWNHLTKRVNFYINTLSLRKIRSERS